MSQLIKDIKEAWLGISVDDTDLFNPMSILDPSEDDYHLRLTWLMTRPEYFSFLCKQIFNIQILPSQALILEEVWNRKFPMLIASRGFGKSFMLSLYSMLRALLLPRRKVVVVGAAFRQSKVLFEYMETIWNNSPILRDICDSDSGPRRDVDRCVMRINDSRITCLPLGDGQKIRGQRANDIISDEFASIPRDIFETVVAGFAAVSSDPIENVKKVASKKLAVELGVQMEEEAKDIVKNRDNQIILSGTAYYDFNHFATYWKKWKSIIKSKGRKESLREVFGGEDPPVDFNWREYSVIRIPYELLPEGFMDAAQVARSKATVHAGIYQMEFGACLEPSTLIQTDVGLKSIKDIEVGDKVLTHKGRFRRVTKTLRRPHRGDIIRMSSYGVTGDVLITPEHPIWLGGDDFNYIDSESAKVRLANLSELSGLRYIDTTLICHNFLESPRGEYIYPQSSQSKITLEQQREIRSSTESQRALSEKYGVSQSTISYIKRNGKIPKGRIPKKLSLSHDFGLILGYYLSEGSVNTSGTSTEFALDEHKDTNFKDQLIRAVYDVFGLDAKLYVGQKNVYRICVNSRLFSSIMTHLCGHYSDGKLTIHDIMFSNPEMLKGIITGYWNGDGHIGNRQADAHCINQDLLLQIKLGLSYFGISSSSMSSGGSFNLKLSGSNFRKFLLDFYGRDIRDTSSRQVIENDGEKSIFPIKNNSKERYDGYVHNLHVEEDESYSLLNMTVHNCFTRDSQGFFKRTLIESCVCNEANEIKDSQGNHIVYEAKLIGDKNKRYVFGVDPASEVDNFSIVVLELSPDHNKIVYCWTTTRDDHKEKVKKGYSTEKDFYAYCARKIRDLMKLFPCVHIAMDAQGGGIAVMESLHDTDKIQDGEHPIWPVIDDDKPQDTDGEKGLHILEMCQFAKYEWLAEANHGLRKDFEDKSTLFPQFDSISLATSNAEDALRGRMFDTLEECMMEIEELKDELAMIQMTQTPSGRDKWDTPEVVVAAGKKSKMRKDRYSALIMANMAARIINRTPTQADYEFYGGFAAIRSGDDKEKEESYINGPAWFTEGMDGVY